MMTAQPQPDGSLPASLERLTNAVAALIDPQGQYVNGKWAAVPSLYMQLMDAVPGQQGSGLGYPRSLVPFWADAFMLLQEIDSRIEIEQPAFTGVPPTVGRLKTILARKWRPQDCHKMEQIAAVVESWVKEIVDKLNPEPVVYLYAPAPSTEPAACTNCGTQRVYRMDSGDRVSQPALRVTALGCRCQHCHASWEPGALRVLAAALGYPLPAGCLE